MNTTRITLGLLLAITVATPLHAQVSAFTYQGRLDLNGAPANGHYDFMFRMLNDPTNGVAAPVIPINLAVPVTNGLFTTGMDFGLENFDGVNRWLEINVRTNGGGSFTTLSPRQLLTPTPYAIAANTASNLLGALPASQISGTILNSSLPASPSFSGTVTANNFSGNGINLTNVNAATLGGLNGSNFWRTSGNAGTTTGTHFLGTTDNQAVEIKVNGMRAMRIEFGGDSDDPGVAPDGAPNIIGGSPINLVGAGVVGATISGGGATNLFAYAYSNSVFANFSTIAGGRGNRIDASPGDATISGGDRNTIRTNAWASTISGGVMNTVKEGVYSGTIGGGIENTVGSSADYAVISGGRQNDAAGAWSVIGGGTQNQVRDYALNSTISGGFGNVVEAFAKGSTIGGGSGNGIHNDAHWGVVSGGSGNSIAPQSDFAIVAGGEGNLVSTNADHSIIGGGHANAVESSAIAAVIVGGTFNILRSGADHCVIGGGYGNAISAVFSTIAGGFGNQILSGAAYSFIGGGRFNTIHETAEYAMILGGYGNLATSYSFAAGNQALATNRGAFVWGDSTEADIASTNANSVTMRASGGYRLFTDANATSGAFLAAGSGSWTSMSDRNAKENFSPVDSQTVLAKVAALPMSTWNYKSQDAGIRHIGPMAQDFKAAFGVGESSTGISTVDADGVALAAIQGLNQKLEETRTENSELRKRLAELERVVQQLDMKQASRGKE